MKRQISIFHGCYLPLSETFIYRQLLGLEKHFSLKVFAQYSMNREAFPDFKPLLLPKPKQLFRLLGVHDRIIRSQLRGSSLLHVNFGYSALEMLPHAMRCSIPITAFFLGEDASAYLRIPSYVTRLRQAEFDAVFVNSEDMKRRLLPYLHPGTVCHVAYCGIPIEQFRYRQRHEVPVGAIFLQVSRLDPKKGVDVTIRAFHRYQRECDPSARLIVAGDGPLRATLLKLTESLDLGKKVTFTGAVGFERYLELLQQADLFIHPSNTSESGDMEGLPTAICEAMACGIPVLSTRHSGIPEIINDGVDGFLVEERDVDGLYEKIVSLQQVAISLISKSARMKIEEKFDHDKTIPILADYMHEIITG